MFKSPDVNTEREQSWGAQWQQADTDILTLCSDWRSLEEICVKPIFSLIFKNSFQL